MPAASSCLQPHPALNKPAWTHLVDGLHATSRQGGVNVKSLVSLHFQDIYAAPTVWQAQFQRRHRRNQLIGPQFPLLLGIKLASLLRKLCQLLLPGSDVSISTCSPVWPMIPSGPALVHLFSLLL